MRGVPETDRVTERLSERGSPRRPEKQEGRVTSRSPLSPDKKSQREERNSTIDAVKQITGAQKKTPTGEGISINETPEYD